MTGFTLRHGIVLTMAALLASAWPGASVARTLSATRLVRSDTVHLGLADAIKRALDDSPGLVAVSERARSADHVADAAFRQHFGDLEAVAWTSRYQDAQLLRPISESLLEGGLEGLPFARDQVHYGLTFELPLFLGGKLLAGSRLARLKADEAQVLLEGTRWQVRANVTTVYATAEALAAVAVAYGDNVEALERTRGRLELMVAQGKRPKVDLLKATDALEEARSELLYVQADLTHTRALLGALLDYPLDQTLELDSLPDHVPTLTADSLDWNSMVDEASTVTAADLRVREATSARHAARAEFLPKVAVRGSLLEHTASSVDGTQQTWEVTLVASVPVFGGGRRLAAYQSAEAAERSAAAALQQSQLQQHAEVRGARARLEAAEAALDGAHSRVVAAVEAARIEGVRYEEGTGTIEDLLRARSRASAAEAFLARTKGDVLGASAQLNALVEREVVR